MSFKKVFETAFKAAMFFLPVALVALVLFFLMMLSSCIKDPISKNQTNNSQIVVDLLFSYDGCRVYRFQDHGEMQYYVRCQGDSAMAMNSHTITIGDKEQLRIKNIQTEEE